MVNSSAYLEDCVITKNNKNGFAICDSALSSSSRLYLSHCDVRGNLGGSFVEEKTVLSTEHGNSFSLNSGLNLSSERENEKIINADDNNGDNNDDDDRMGMVSSVEQTSSKNSIVGDSNNCTPNDQSSNINNSDNNHTNNISSNNDSNTNNGYNNKSNDNDNNGSINNMNAGVNTLNNIINTDINSKNTEQLSSSLSASKEPSSSNTVIQERTFFLRKCIGDEEAMKFFKKFEWFDPLNDVDVEVEAEAEVEDDRESPQLVINLVPSNSQKESVKEKIVRSSTNLPRSSSLTNINNTGNSKRKRVEENDTNFKENFDRLFGDYEKDFFEGIEVPDKKGEIRKDEYERCSGVVENSDVMRVIKKEKREGGNNEIHHDDITMKIEKI